METGLTLLTTASLPLKFWDEAFFIATLLINRLPTPLLSFKSPFGKLFLKQPDYASLRVFGCSCFPLMQPYHKHKMNFKLEKCTFIGYSPFHKGFKCLTSSGKIIISRHVTFNETSFPFANKSSATECTNSVSSPFLPTAQPPTLIFHNAPCAVLGNHLPVQNIPIFDITNTAVLDEILPVAGPVITDLVESDGTTDIWHDSTGPLAHDQVPVPTNNSTSHEDASTTAVHIHRDAISVRNMNPNMTVDLTGYQLQPLENSL